MDGEPFNKRKKYFWYLLHSRCQCPNFIFYVFKSLHLINHTNEQCMLVYLVSVDVSIECMPVLNNHNLFLWYDCQYWNIPLQRAKQVLKICFYYKNSFHRQDKFWMHWTTFQKKKKNCVNCLFKSWCKCDNFTIRACKKPLFNPSYKWTVYLGIPGFCWCIYWLHPWVE